MTSNGSRTNSALLVAVVALGLSHILGGAPRAAAQQAGGQAMFAVVAPGAGGAGSNVLFLIDPPSGRLAVYEHRTGSKLELVAVRNITHELQYEEWPAGKDARAQVPSVEAIVEDLRKRQAPPPRGG